MSLLSTVRLPWATSLPSEAYPPFSFYRTTVWELNDELEFIEAVSEGNRVGQRFERLEHYRAAWFFHRGST